MAIRATWSVADDHQAAGEQAETEEACFAVVLPGVLDLEVGAVKHSLRIAEDEATCLERRTPLGWIKGDRLDRV
ncbi:MAG: hypothetical protein NW201_02920 [Gemmatimonadales bacterium]|nr:hypothetical protein [Gemmatimonadales bacterium]